MADMTSSSLPADQEPTPWLSEEELAAWKAFVAMLLAVPPAIDAQLKRDAGINLFEYTIVAGLSEMPDRTARMAVLAQLAAVSASRLSHAVSRLERQGWVERRTHAAGEPRSTEVVLTDAGMAMVTAAAPAHVREARHLVFDGLTPAQVGQLQKLCGQLLGTAAPETAALLERFR
jgi:DNA-binding MarR family transcriptional regulator